MKLLLVHNYYRQRGGEDVVFELERDLLRSNGHSVVEYCRSNYEISELTTIGKIAAAKTTIWADDSNSDFRSILRHQKYDVIHVHNTFPRISPSIYWACREAGVPVVQTLHNYRLLCPSANFFRDSHICRECAEHGIWRGVRHGCYRASRRATATVAIMLTVHRWSHTWTTCVDRYIAPSNFARRQFIAAGLPAEKVVIKPNFVYPDPGGRTEARDFVVYLGRLSEEKGLATLLSAWKLLDGRVPLMIIGDGPLRATLQAQADREGVSGVEFRGQLGRVEALALLKSARFLVLPSECYETFGLTIAEAYACGVPVIASSLGALGEIVEPGRTGLSFRAGNVSELTKKVSWAWKHPEAMVAMGRAARVSYETRYTATRNYEMLMEVYKAAIAECSSRHTAAESRADQSRYENNSRSHPCIDSPDTCAGK
jgi:glycosyltransferase involved in cell wall biosynthesis